MLGVSSRCVVSKSKARCMNSRVCCVLCVVHFCHGDDQEDDGREETARDARSECWRQQEEGS